MSDLQPTLTFATEDFAFISTGDKVVILYFVHFRPFSSKLVCFVKRTVFLDLSAVSLSVLSKELCFRCFNTKLECFVKRTVLNFRPFSNKLEYFVKIIVDFKLFCSKLECFVKRLGFLGLSAVRLSVLSKLSL